MLFIRVVCRILSTDQRRIRKKNGSDLTPALAIMLALQYLNQFLLFQVPLLDAVVAGAAEQHVAVYGQALDAVVVRRLKVVSGTDVPLHAFRDIKHL